MLLVSDGKKSRHELLFLDRMIPKRRRKNKPFCIWSTSSLWQSVLYIVKQYKCIVMLLYYSGHITIICNYIIKAKGVSYVCFENINESVIYKTPYHQNKIRMLIMIIQWNSTHIYSTTNFSLQYSSYMTYVHYFSYMSNFHYFCYI